MPLTAFCATLLLSLATGAVCDDRPVLSTEERLAALERQVAELSRENALLKRQSADITTGSPVRLPPDVPVPKLRIGGFLQFQAEFGHAPDPRWTGARDRFYFRRARFHVTGTLHDELDFKAELDLQGNTLGAATGLLARANEIFVNWHRYPAANLRFGQLKPAFGSEALGSDTRTATIERSLASDRLTDGRQLGIGTAGKWCNQRLSHYVVLANGNGANVSTNDNARFQTSARLAFTPVMTANSQLVLGLDGLWANDNGVGKSGLGLAGDSFTGRREMWGIDVKWTHGIVELDAEWLHGSFHPSQPAAHAPFDAAGWHATLSCFLIPSRLQAVFRHEAFDPDTGVGGNSVRTQVFGLNIPLRGDDIRLMVDYLDGHSRGGTVDRGRLLSRLQVIY